MDRNELRRKIIEKIPIGTIIDNPGGGTSTIITYTEKKVTYQRRNSKIGISFDDLYDAFVAFRGRVLDSTMLKSFKPRVFDSNQNGHSCNCTFLFMVLKELGIVNRINGAGKRGSPFKVHISE